MCYLVLDILLSHNSRSCPEVHVTLYGMFPHAHVHLMNYTLWTTVKPKKLHQFVNPTLQAKTFAQQYRLRYYYRYNWSREYPILDNLLRKILSIGWTSSCSFWMQACLMKVETIGAAGMAEKRRVWHSFGHQQEHCVQLIWHKNNVVYVRYRCEACDWRQFFMWYVSLGTKV